MIVYFLIHIIWENYHFNHEGSFAISMVISLSKSTTTANNTIAKFSWGGPPDLPLPNAWDVPPTQNFSSPTSNLRENPAYVLGLTF